MSITNGIVSSKIYDKRDDFTFEIVNFPFLDGDVRRSSSYSVYISQLIRFARVCSNVDELNNRNLFLTAKLLKQGYRYHKIRKAFSKFYHRHSELIVKYNIGLKTLLQQGISEPIFYGDLVYKFKRTVGKPNFSDQFKKIVKRYIRVGYNLDIMRQSACLVLNPITVQGGTSFVDLFCFCSVLCLLCLCARLFKCALWSPAGKGLTSWLSFVVSTVSLSLSHWYPGSGVVLDCIDS